MYANESAVLWALGIAADESHGYDQDNRWGPDYDCSSLVIQAFEQAGIHTAVNGASYTGDMKAAFIKSGFMDVTSLVNLANAGNMLRGDVLLRESGHAAIYTGNGRLVNAQWNELGKKTGGVTGDQTGKEICERSYYNSPWSCVLRLQVGTPGVPWSGPFVGFIPTKTKGHLKVMKRYYIGGVG